MEIQVFDTIGKMIPERHYFPDWSRTESSYLISDRKPGIYFVSIMMDDMVKTQKL